MAYTERQKKSISDFMETLRYTAEEDRLSLITMLLVMYVKQFGRKVAIDLVHSIATVNKIAIEESEKELSDALNAVNISAGQDFSRGKHNPDSWLGTHAMTFKVMFPNGKKGGASPRMAKFYDDYMDMLTKCDVQTVRNLRKNNKLILLLPPDLSEATQ